MPYFGKNTVGVSVNSSGHRKRGCWYELLEEGRVTYVSMYFNHTGLPAKVAIYDSAGNLVLQSTCETITEIGWHHFAVPPTILPPSRYLLTWLYGDGRDVARGDLRYDVGETNQVWIDGWGVTCQNQFTSTFGPEYYRNYAVSIYATYNQDTPYPGGQPPPTETTIVDGIMKTQIAQGEYNHLWGQIQGPLGTPLANAEIWLNRDGVTVPPEEVEVPGGYTYPVLSKADGGIDLAWKVKVAGTHIVRMEFKGTAEYASSLGAEHSVFVVPPYVPIDAPVIQNPPPPDARERTDRIGISISPRFSAHWNDYLATKSAWTRVEINWQDTEKQKGVYDWSIYDEWFALLFDNNIAMVGLLDYGNILYTGAWNNPPVTQEQIDAWLNFVREAVTRYKDKIRVWEVWNEPNASGFWGGDKTGPGQGGNAVQYTNLLKQTYSLIKSIDPTAKVMLGGLWGNDCKFLQAIYLNGGRDYSDIVGIHPYPGMFLPNHVWGWYKLPGWDASAWGGYSPFDYPLLVKIWQIMDYYGDGTKPIWITELGWGTRATDKPHPDSGFIGTAQEMYAEGIKMAWNFLNDKNINWKWAENIDPPAGVARIPNVEKMIIHIFDDGGGTYGLYEADATRREVAYQALKTLANTYNTEVPTPTHVLTISSTINTTPIEGVPIKINGVEHVTPISLELPEGTHIIEAVTPIQIIEKTYRFIQWEDGSTNPQRTINLTADMTLTATYEEVIAPTPPTPILPILFLGGLFLLLWEGVK